MRSGFLQVWPGTPLICGTSLQGMHGRDPLRPGSLPLDTRAAKVHKGERIQYHPDQEEPLEAQVEPPRN